MNLGITIYELKWDIEWILNVIPRGVWSYDNSKVSVDVQTKIKRSGFIFEFIFAGLSLLIGYILNIMQYSYIVIIFTIIHRITYPIYAGNNSDLK